MHDHRCRVYQLPHIDHEAPAPASDPIERCGSTLPIFSDYEGNLRQRYYFGGELLDEHYFGLHKDEWCG